MTAPGMGLRSMTSRVALAVVSAFVAVFVVLFIWIWQDNLGRDTGDLERSLLRAAKSFAATLDELDSDEGARATAALFRGLEVAGDPAQNPPVHLALARLDGSGAQHVGPVAGLDLSRLPEGASTQDVGGVTWRLYTATGRQWKVALLDDVPVRRQLVGWVLFTDLLAYMGLALPLVLVPVWLMARASLKPLRQLSDTVAARSPLDHSPLPSGGRWKELVPLERALNQLFQRTAQGLARERAFVHDAAHELRTPLAVIATQAHVLARSEGVARDEAQQRLHAAVTRASHLAQQLLQLARADSAARLQPEAVDLMNLARDAMALMSERAAAQGTELDLRGPDHVPLLSDPRALRSVLDNLLDNALRYGGPGGLVTVDVAQHADRWHLTVRDSGPGIEAANRESVFERFWRGAGHQQPGSGLGLAIVREAARALGGEASVLACEAGAAVQVRLPSPEARP